jgi:hypothetical protein
MKIKHLQRFVVSAFFVCSSPHPQKDFWFIRLPCPKLNVEQKRLQQAVYGKLFFVLYATSSLLSIFSFAFLKPPPSITLP